MPVGRRKLLPCGTMAGYRRHRAHGETPCSLCLSAQRGYSNAHGHKPDEKRTYDTSRYTRQRDRILDNAKAWYAKNKGIKQQYDRVRKRTMGRALSLKYSYGISETDFERRFNQQGRRCACCMGTNPKGRNWCVDHDHVTGELRGILCNTCNTGIGGLGDNLIGVLNAQVYLDPGMPRVDEHW